MGDEMAEMIKSYIEGERVLPGKTESLGLRNEEKYYLRHRSAFRITNQHVLIRFWSMAAEKIVPLIFVGEDALVELLYVTHHSEGSPNRHLGMRKTFNMLRHIYYAFN